MLRQLFLLLLLAATTFGQGTDRLLTTLGTAVEKDGGTRVYLLWQPGDASATFGKRFAIYSKPGDLDVTAKYSREGIQQLQTSANTIRAMLELGDKVDFQAGMATERIAAIHREITLEPGSTPAAPSDPSLDAGEKLAYLFAGATTDPKLLDRLFFLGRAHPGVMLALGHGFVSAPIAAGTRTYEIREVDAADNDIRVVGRVVIDPAAPPLPAAPGRPIHVTHENPTQQFLFSTKDHLNARFRWGLGPQLRQDLPHTFGFTLFRVAKDFAEDPARKWNSTPPPRQDFLATLATQDPAEPVVSPVNSLPVMIDSFPTPAEAAAPGDPKNIFIADDKNPPADPFQDGDQFYYFVAARTITGHPGEISTGTLVQLCDRLPPRPPKIAAVENRFTGPADPAEWADQGGSQHLRLKIRQVDSDDPGEAVSHYRIYRWEASAQYLDDGGLPDINHVGDAPHVPGETFITFDDLGYPGSPGNANSGETVWYTARSVDAISCPDKNYSAHSAPKYGVIRERRGMPAPTGIVRRCHFCPFLSPDRENNRFPQLVGPEKHEEDPALKQTRFQFVRSSTLVSFVDVHLEIDAGKDRLTIFEGRLRFPANASGTGITVPRSAESGIFYTLTARTSTGRVCDEVKGSIGDVAYGEQAPYPLPIFQFRVEIEKICLPTELDPRDPAIHDRLDEFGVVSPVPGTLNLPANTAEWRVYRRVGRDGDLSLIAKDQGDSLPADVDWLDAYPPAAADSLVCYYAQVFDGDGNPSPLTRLDCLIITHSDLPIPLVSPTENIDDAGNPRVKLSWFCDPAGVERFEVLVATSDGSTPDFNGQDLGSEINPLTETFPGVNGADDLVFHTFQTFRVGAGLGDGPEFSATVDMPVDKQLAFIVRAVGPGSFGERSRGEPSNLVDAVWVENEEPMDIIPWPARPLPGRYDITRPVLSFTRAEGPIHARKITDGGNYAQAILIGACNGFVEQTGDTRAEAYITSSRDRPPEELVFKIRAQNTNGSTELQDLLPFVVYRYQLDSPAYPNAVANLVQCTPLIDRFAWDYNLTGKDPGYVMREPYLDYYRFDQLGGVPVSGTLSPDSPGILGNPIFDPRPEWTEGANLGMWLRDLLPVTAGTRYRHVIVNFDERGGVRHVIPLNPVQH